MGVVRQADRNRRRETALIIGLVAVLVVLPTLMLLYLIAGAPSAEAPFARKPFNRATWVAHGSEDEYANPRGPMTADLRRRFLHRGMSRREARKLLGEPDNSADDEHKGDADHYLIGHWGFMSIEGDQLVIHYDRAGRVASTEILTH